MVKINKKYTHRKHLNQFSAKIMMLGILLVMSIPLISAADLFNFDNYKTFDENIGEYGKITIFDKSLFGEDTKLKEYVLEVNTDFCAFDCSMEMEIIMYEDGILIEENDYLRLNEDGSWSNGKVRSEQFYIMQDDKKIPYEVGTEVVGSEEGINYYIILEAVKNPKHTLDWRITSSGQVLEEWRVWAEGDFVTSWLRPDTIHAPHGITQCNNRIWLSIVGTGRCIFEEYTMDGIFITNYTSNTSNFNCAGFTCNGTFFWSADKTRNEIFKYDLNFNYINSRPIDVVDDDPRGLTNNGTNLFLAITSPDVNYRYDFEVNLLGNFSTETTGGYGVATYKNFMYILQDTNPDTITRNYTNSSARPEGRFALNVSNNEMNGMTTDGIFLWGIDTGKDRVYQYYVGLEDVIVNLDNPSDNNISIDSPMIFNSSAGAGVGFNFTNATIKIYSQSEGLIKEETNIVLGNLENSTGFSITDLPLGTLTWNVIWCVDDTTEIVCKGADSNRTLIFGIKINSETFNDKTTEGATETFAINFTKLSSTQVSTVNLIYNGTRNPFATSVNGNVITSQGSIIILPKSTAVNVSFHWNIIFDNGEQINTTSNIQEIAIIDIDDCDVFTNLIYNFTQFDEESQTKLTTNNTMEIQVNLYDTAKSVNLANFSQKFFGENPATVCLESALLTTVNYSSYVVVKYSANLTSSTPSYTTEYYNILNQTIANSTVPKTISLFSLKDDDATKFRLTFRDGAYTLAPNILVQVHRQYVEDNDFKVVEIPLTDNNGQTILNLVRNEIIYNFIFVNEARQVIATFNQVTAFCQDFTIGECTIILSAESIGEDIFDYNEEFGISISRPTFDNLTELISIEFITNDLLPKNVRMDVIRNNAFGNRSVCSSSLTAASGIISCGGSSITENDQFLFVQTSVNGELAKQDTINLNAASLSFGVINGSFYAFLIILFLICLFMDDKKILVVVLGIGWVIIISLGLVSGQLVGVLSAGIWLLITIIIFLWKLNKEGGSS